MPWFLQEGSDIDSGGSKNLLWPRRKSQKPTMRVATPASSPRSRVGSARVLYPQPTIDPFPGNPSIHPPSPRTDNSLSSVTNEYWLDHERTAAALRDAMDGDLMFDARQHNPNTYSFHSKSPRDLVCPSTLPSASLGPILSLLRLPSDSKSNAIASAPPIPAILARPTSPARSSVDTLRFIQKREMHWSVSANAQPSWSPNWWFQNKEDVEPLLSDRDQTDASGPTKEKIQKRYRAPKEACVLVHGCLVSIRYRSVTIIVISYWRGIKEALETIGCEVVIAKDPIQTLPGRKVHLIGHSMGGLDCRYLVAHLRSDRFTPISVTTIATPHRGSSFADHFIATLGRERMPSLLSLLDMLPNGGGDGKAFDSLTLDAMRKFNETTPMFPMSSISPGGHASNQAPQCIQVSSTFSWPHSVILEKEGPNDGLVSVESSKWGTYLGTLEGVNHPDLVGWVNTARYKWADLTGKSIQYKAATFYLQIADMLAERVEMQPELETTEADSKPPPISPSPEEERRH
ncbi:hypothetical protein BS47DRAFT_1366065 [Hydnum rufescens UP504]|uniref:DUF676 domain-containing protein n=1 Tax=Hydnum rufescens UP504 TaxID=1448309 RepID=A0A9P6ALW7_9AGAM|nr:hypothetical protein BS47DRAFT_1366065 [Hydnum rufescens UP504]